MIEQIQKANLFKSLHISGNPLILYNIWDVGGAKALQESGARAIATSSWSVAASHGYDDGEKLPFNLVIENSKRISSNVKLPVTIDLEGGYGKTPTELIKTVKKIIEAGAIGINFEDQIVGHKILYSIEEQSKRIKAVRQAAEQTSIPIFMNARTDLFLMKSDPNETDIEHAICRAAAYADAGADGFFVPGLKETKHIEKLCKYSPIPINIMILPTMISLSRLAELGVSRISYGPSPYHQVMDFLKRAAVSLHLQHEKIE